MGFLSLWLKRGAVLHPASVVSVLSAVLHSASVVSIPRDVRALADEQRVDAVGQLPEALSQVGRPVHQADVEDLADAPGALGERALRSCGGVVVRDRHVLTIDEATVLAEAAEYASQIKAAVIV